MNYRFGRTANAAEKKEGLSSAAFALAVGLALLLPGAAALATPGTPIVGIPIGLEGDPGSIKVSTTTNEHGAFNFGKLPAGKYKLTLPSLPSQSFTVANGIVGGTVMRGSDGSITVRKAGDKPVDYVFRLAPPPTNAIGGTYTTGDFTAPQMRAFHPTAAPENNGDGKSAAAEPRDIFLKPPVTPRKGGDAKLPGIINNSETETATVDVTNGIGGQGGGRFTFKPTSRVTDSATVETSNRDHIDQDAQTDVRKKTAVQTGSPEDARIRVSADVSTLRVQNYGIRVTETAPGTDGGDAKLPGIINNSETETATVDVTNGIGGQGGGRFTFKPTSRGADSATVETSNRDHIDQDAQTDVKKKTAVQSDGPGDARIRVSADVSTLRVTETAPGTDGGDGKLPGKLRVINNSETETATINQSTPVNGIGGTGGGRLMAGGAIDGGDGNPPGLAGDPIVITDNLGNTHVLGRAATSPKGGNSKLPGLADQPIAGLDVKLGKLGGGIMATINSSGAIIAAETMVSSRTDSQGNFHFDKLPAGNYELTLPGLPAQSLTVGTDGIAGGTVMRGPDGNMTIFDRWGNRTATAPKGGGSKTAEKPGGFGSGNTMGTGLGGMGSGGGMTPPGAGPAMGGAGPAMGGPGSAMGGPGSAMRNR